MVLKFSASRLQPFGQLCFFIAMTMLFADNTNAITSIYGPPETTPDYVTVPGQQQFGVSHDFIVSLRAFESGSYFPHKRATGILLSTGRHIMTAAHLFDSPSLIGGSVDVRFDLPDGELLTVPISIDDKVEIHEFYAGGLDGFDIAIIELPRNFIDVAKNERNFDLVVSELLPRINKSLNPEGLEARLAGYGRQGNWEFGQQVPGAFGYIGGWGEKKILGKNTISAVGYDFPILGNEYAMLFWDFDDVAALETNFFGDPFTGDVAEVMIADEDSGGPIFVNTGSEWVVAGIASGSLGDDEGIGSDFNNESDSSAGEVGFGVHLNQMLVYPWVFDMVWNQKVMRPWGNWDSTWDDATYAWTNSTLPGAGQAVTVGFDAAGNVPFLGPAGSHTIESLTIGTGAGLKQMFLSAGGSLSMPGDTTVEANGSIVLEAGMLSADTLVIQGTANVPQTPTPEKGFVIWTNENNYGNSSLIVNRIEVGQDGVFQDLWLNNATRTFQSQTGGFVDVDVLAGGEAYFEVNNEYIGDLTNSGIFSLGEQYYGNEVVADSLSQSSAGELKAYYGEDPSLGLLTDYMTVYGPVALAGKLSLAMLGSGNFIIEDSDFIIKYASRIGVFDSVEGLDMGDGKWLLLTYAADRLAVTVHLAGDLNGDGFVGIADLNIVLGAWNQQVTAGLGTNGDPSGDGYVGIADMNIVLGNWNAGTPPGMIDDTAFGLIAGLTKEKSLGRFSGEGRAIPEPGTIGLIGLGMTALLGRRRRGNEHSGHRVNGRSMVMRGTKQVAAAVLGAALLGSSSADAAISFDLTPVDNSAVLTGYTTYDLDVTTDSDWTAAAMLFELSAGSFYQHAYGDDGGPPNPFFVSLFPELVFDTYVAGTPIGSGGAGDIGGDAYAFGTGELDVSWYNLATTDIGTTTIGRLTLTDDAAGSLSIMLTAGSNEEALFTVTFDAGTAQSPVQTLMANEPSASDILAADLARWQARDLPDGFFYPGMPRKDPDPLVQTNYIMNKLTGHIPTTRPSRTSVVAESSDSTTPEPGTLALIGAGVGLAMLRRW